MPKITTKTEGRGNGIKTILTNIVDVAKAIGRPTSYPVKFFGSELGTNTVCDEKSGRFFINGPHTPEELLEVLYAFIEQFVLCGRCQNPETDIVIGKSAPARKCNACGESTAISLSHKLTSYITKNPPKRKQVTSIEKKEPAQNIESKYVLFAEDLISRGTLDESVIETAEKSGIRRDRAIAVFAQCMLKKAPLERLSKSIFLLKAWIETEEDLMAFLGGIERLPEHSDIPAEQLIPAALQMLYVHELASEAALVHWKTHYLGNYVGEKAAVRNRKAAEAFFGWLVQSEDEESE